MRKWYKYSLSYGQEGRINLPVDQSFEDHVRAIGGYDADEEAYANKAAFFARYFLGYHRQRLEYYDTFIRGVLQKDDKVLSIASGRAANELYLGETGYKDVTCSDLSRPSCYEKTRTIFPSFRFMELDILSSPAPEQYDAVICLSLIYLFDNAQLARILENVRQSLRKGGHFVLDSAGSPDNIVAYLIHDVLLRVETAALWFGIAVLRGKPVGFLKKHHGYRRNDREIVEAAARAGFTLRSKKDFSFSNEWRRSIVFDRLFQASPLLRRAIEWMGRTVPYIRMFDFQAVAP